MADDLATIDESQALVEKLKNVRDLLQQTGPLTKRQVMAPFTTKAFFAAQLKPTLDTNNNNAEQVSVRMVTDSQLVEMTRSEAIAYLDKRIAEKEPTTTSADQKGVEPSSSSSSAAAAAAALPFFEIREQLDQEGREVGAEAVNVAKELEYLQQKQASKADATIVPGDGAMDDAPLSSYDEAPLKPVSDQDYEALSNRLEELARLEEQAGASKRESQMSSMKLQSKGWAKGFLNTDKPKKKANKNSVSKVIEPDTKERKVGFHEHNQVREITRIGQRSASELKPPSQRNAVVEERKAIEPQVFSGVIRERPIGITSSSTSSTTLKPAKSTAAPRKKISRFAQERQEHQQ